MTKTLIRVQDLQLRDTLEVFEGPFGTGLVIKISPEAVTVFRPYATTADFTYTGGVIPYIGVETFDLSPLDTRPVILLRRDPVPEGR